jgi:hypothetical protein
MHYWRGMAAVVAFWSLAWATYRWPDTALWVLVAAIVVTMSGLLFVIASGH